MVDESQFSNLRRDAFTDDVSDVFEGQAAMASVPTSAIEDLGFTPEQVARDRDGLYNADFRTPPPEGTGIELDDQANKLPGWSYVRTGTAVTAKWYDDVAGGQVRFYSTGSSADEAYIEQVIPVSATIGTSIGHRLWCDFTAVSGTPTMYATAAYLDSSLAVTGSVSTVDLTATYARSGVVAPNAGLGVRTDAFYLRIRIGATATGTYTGSINGARVVVAQRPDIWWESISSGRSDWAPVSNGFWDAVDVLMVDGGAASRNITGLLAPTLPGRRKTIVNAGSSDNLVLVHNATSTAANRFFCPGNADLTIRPRGSVDVMYLPDSDLSNPRWRVVAP